MKRLGPFLVCIVVVSIGTSAWAEIHNADLIGEWCLVHQSMNGHDFESLSLKAIQDNLRAKLQQSYHFLDAQTVKATMAGTPNQSFTYKISVQRVFNSFQFSVICYPSAYSE